MKSSLFIISLIIFFSACKKDKGSSTPTPPVHSCKIATATRLSNSTKVTYTLSYDDSGRISQLVYDGQDAYTKKYSYKGNMIYIDVAAGANSSTDTITLNSFKLISTHKETVPQAVYNISYNYDRSGILISSTSQQDNYPPSTITYNFINGDLTNTTSEGITDTTTYFSDKTSVIGNLDDFNQLISGGAFYYKNKNLKKSYHYGNMIFNYSYSFDSDGKIISVLSNYGATSDTTNFTYTCH